MKNAMQLKSIVKNISKEKHISAQLVLQNYMLERLLVRISVSSYKESFILKGGFLIASIVGLHSRATMDMDITIKGELVTAKNIELIFDEILNISIEDNVIFKFESLEEIRENDDYNGYRVHLSASFAPMCVPLKLDITTGDKITPKEIKYEYKSMMDENTSISILAYNIETVIAEKLEAILSRGDQTTRLRDYYDVYILWKLQRANINIEYLSAALTATVNKRGTLNVIKDYKKTMDHVRESNVMHEQWEKYQHRFDYAKEISFGETCNAIIEIMEII